jgi:hypothetical protein
MSNHWFLNQQMMDLSERSKRRHDMTKQYMVKQELEHLKKQR